MAMKTLKKVDIMSFAKIQSIFAAIAGFIVGISFAVISAFVSALGPMEGADPTAAASMGALGYFGTLAIIIFPILYAVIGFIAGIIMAFIYNLLAKYVGGIQVDLE